MRAKFVELRCFSVLFNGIQRIFERNDMSMKYSRNIHEILCLLLFLPRANYQAALRKVVLPVVNFRTKTTNFRFRFVKVSTTFH